GARQPRAEALDQDVAAGGDRAAVAGIRCGLIRVHASVLPAVGLPTLSGKRWFADPCRRGMAATGLGGRSTRGVGGVAPTYGDSLPTPPMIPWERLQPRAFACDPVSRKARG